MVNQDFKERCVDGEIKLYQWILNGMMWADALTKEIERHQDMRELLMEGDYSLSNDGINKVQYVDSEIRMTNIQNRDRKKQQESREDVC